MRLNYSKHAVILRRTFRNYWAINSSFLIQTHSLHSSNNFHQTILREKSMEDHLTKLVLESDSHIKYLFSASVTGGILSGVSVVLFVLTYVYHIGKPVMDAYRETKKKNDSEQEEDDDK